MIVVEKYLDVLGGHEATQVAAIQSLVGNRPLTFVTGRQCELSLDGGQILLPVLSTRKEIKDTPKQAVDQDLQSMSDILVSEKARHGPILYVTAQSHDLRVGLRLVSILPLCQRLYMRVLLEREIIQLTNDELTALKSAIAAGQIVLLTETESLAAHFLARYGLKFNDTALCLPCSIVPSQSASLSSLPQSKTSHFRVGCLGGWRAEKGVEMIPQIIRHMRYALDAADNAPKVELVLQKGARWKTFRGIRKSLKRDYRFWRSVGFTVPGKRLSLSFRKTNLSQEDFLATLLSVDMLLVPYRLNDYRHRGSGIILDGVAARKPIVYTRGMGMSEFLTHGNAEAASEEPKDYADKVVRVLSDIEVYRTAADKAAVEFDQRIQQTALLLRSI